MWWGWVASVSASAICVLPGINIIAFFFLMETQGSGALQECWQGRHDFCLTVNERLNISVFIWTCVLMLSMLLDTRGPKLLRKKFIDFLYPQRAEMRQVGYTAGFSKPAWLSFLPVLEAWTSWILMSLWFLDQGSNQWGVCKEDSALSFPNRSECFLLWSYYLKWLW